MISAIFSCTALYAVMLFTCTTEPSNNFTIGPSIVSHAVIAVPFLGRSVFNCVPVAKYSVVISIVPGCTPSVE